MNIEVKSERTNLNVIIALVFSLLAIAACGQVSLPVNSDPEDGGFREVPEAEDNGLQVRLAGVVSGTTLCPGNTRPCAELEGDLSLDDGPLPTSDQVYVSGTLAEGVLKVQEIEPVRSDTDWRVDRCDNKKTESEFLDIAATSPEDSGIEEGGELEDYDQLGLYQLTIPESFATRWLSPKKVIHVGVVGDARPHQEAIAELGFDDYVCVVGGFDRSDNELEQIQNEVVSFLKAWPEVQSWAAPRNAHLGSVQVDIHRADERMLTAAEEQFGDGVDLNASILVFNGTLAEYDAAIVNPNNASVVPTADSIGLVASCGTVEFSTLPPDLESFDPIDAEIETLLAEFASGPLSVESSDFVPAFEWSVATRNDTKLVLFGQSETEGFANVTFVNQDGVWSASGWGGCNMELKAPGFGPARTILDPDHKPDPNSTELAILINEQSCASGMAPVDREVLPLVIESETRIEVITLVAPLAGIANCPGNPWHPVKITLQQPLGDRVVFDGQSIPAEERTWPPSQNDLNG